MMNAELHRAFERLEMNLPSREQVRLAFALACADRCAHLLEDPRAKEIYQQLKAELAAGATVSSLANLATDAYAVARGHAGSASLDGSGHSAVSATHALANAFAGKALEAAEYSAYAIVYSYGRYAVADPESFQPEFEWQLQALHSLASHQLPNDTAE